jgi:uncharacterized protein
MSKDNVATVRRGYELFEAGDFEGVSKLFCSEAELARAGGLGLEDAGADTRYGPEGFLSGTAETLEAFDDYSVEVEDFIDTGEAVVVPVRISGRGKASGVSLEMHLVHVWTFHSSGKIMRSQVYRTVDEALAAAGKGSLLG